MLGPLKGLETVFKSSRNGLWLGVFLRKAEKYRVSAATNTFKNAFAFYIQMTFVSPNKSPLKQV